MKSNWILKAVKGTLFKRKGRKMENFRPIVQVLVLVAHQGVDHH